MSSIFGHVFRISTFGESHGGGIGVVIDGCPPGVPLAVEEVQRELDRRRPGQSKVTTPRKEADQCEILSGVFEGQTTGAALAMLVRNEDARSSAYEEMAVKYRPSHADYTYDAKYGFRSWPGGGRASARETIGRVAAAAVARKVLESLIPGYEAVAYVKSIKNLQATVDPCTVKFSDVESNIVRTGDPAMVEPMIALIEATRAAGNSVGGVVECAIFIGRSNVLLRPVRKQNELRVQAMLRRHAACANGLGDRKRLLAARARGRLSLCWPTSRVKRVGARYTTDRLRIEGNGVDRPARWTERLRLRGPLRVSVLREYVRRKEIDPP